MIRSSIVACGLGVLSLALSSGCNKAADEHQNGGAAGDVHGRHGLSPSKLSPEPAFAAMASRSSSRRPRASDQARDFSPALSREFRHGIVDPIERNGRRESVPLVIREEGNARTHSSSSMKLEPRYPALSPRGLGHRGS